VIQDRTRPKEEIMIKQIQVSRAAVLVFLLGAALSPSAWVQTEEARTGAGEAEFVEWVRESAISLDADAWTEADLAGFAALDKLLEGKRFVYLGEADHYVREKYDFRLIFIEYLFKKGFRRIGMEMGYSDGKRIDRYLATGDEAILDRVTQFGFKGYLREDRDDIPAGFPGIENPEFRKTFFSEELRFIRKLRALNESLSPGGKRLSWFGFDISFFPGGGYVDARKLLEEHSSEPLVKDILQRMQRVEGESRLEEAERLRGLLEHVQERSPQLEGLLGATAAKELTTIILRLAESLVFCEAANQGPMAASWLSGLIEREQTMCRFMDDYLEELGPDEKIIFMGHNLHLCKKSQEITLGPAGSPMPKMWKAIGTHLALDRPGEVFAVWMTYDHGRHGTVLIEAGVEDVPSRPGSVESFLARAGPVFFLPLNSGDGREAFLRKEIDFNQNGSVSSAIVPDQADAIFFVREVSAIRK
jgi:erythromycin esterase-like protein